ncbi:MAG: F0F1 ATP synthase subunit delta, partial [Rhodospirillales bacterium]
QGSVKKLNQGVSQVSSDIAGASGLAGRYATALYELAAADKQLDTVAQDMAAIRDMIDESADLARLIRSPVIARDSQIAAMDAILTQAGISELTKHFVGVVAQNRRLFALTTMIKQFQGILAQHRGEMTAEVVSAQALSDKQRQAIEDGLKKAMGTKVAVDARVDEDLLGGLVVKIGSRMIDSSIKTKLQQLRLSMR